MTFLTVRRAFFSSTLSLSVGWLRSEQCEVPVQKKKKIELLDCVTTDCWEKIKGLPFINTVS